MPELLVALDAFLQDHRRCGDLDARVEPAHAELAPLAASLSAPSVEKKTRIGPATADRRATTIAVRGAASSGPHLTA